MGWALKKPERYQGYRKPMYDFLKSAHAARLPCPTAHDVLDEFRKKSNSDVIEVMSDGLKYATRPIGCLVNCWPNGRLLLAVPGRI
jgi:hypothetical protein